MAAALPTGIFRTATGYRVFQWVPDPTRPQGRVRSKRFTRTDTHEPTIKEMQHWQEDQRVDARKPRLAAPAPTTLTGFAKDALTYLEAVAAMPTFSTRARHIGEWIALFGDRPRASITPTEIRTQRDRWLTVGPKMVMEKPAGEPKARYVPKPIPLSASAVNHRLRALENMYTVLDGRRAPNPVREVPEVTPPEEEPRALPYELVARILAAMPDQSRPEKGVKGSRDGDSKTKARLTVIAYVGLSHSQLMRVKSTDVDLKARTLFLRPRRKGRSSGRAVKGETIPLLPQAVKAFRHFAALDCWGYFSTSSMRMSFRRACASLDLPTIPRPIDFRHSFGTMAYQATGDLRATGVLLGHRDMRTTTRYTTAAVDPRLAAALRGMRIPGKAKSGHLTGGKVSPGKVSRRDRSERTRTR